jgi:branched-subunit amino acid transport protein
VLTAVWAPELFFGPAGLSISPGNERLMAGLIAIAVAWRVRSTFATIAAGLAALHLLSLLKSGI